MDLSIFYNYAYIYLFLNDIILSLSKFEWIDLMEWMEDISDLWSRLWFKILWLVLVLWYERTEFSCFKWGDLDWEFKLNSMEWVDIFFYRLFYILEGICN